MIVHLATSRSSPSHTPTTGRSSRRVDSTSPTSGSARARRPGHTHEDEDQVYYVAAGDGFVELDAVRTDVAAGSSVLIPLGTEHAITNTGTEPLDYVFFVVFIPEHA